jgi:RNA polymerase sigma factor (sigma-70 family)
VEGNKNMTRQPLLPPDGQETDMAQVYKDLRASLMRFASRYFRRPQEIEDVVQEAFVKVIEAQHQREIREPRSYLFRTTRNLALSELDRCDNRLTDTIGDLLPELELLQTPPLEQQFESRQRFDAFCRAVRRLPTKGRRVYILRRVYGFTQKETAEHLGITIKTVEAHQAKAMVRCADFMAEEELAGNKNGGEGFTRRNKTESAWENWNE